MTLSELNIRITQYAASKGADGGAIYSKDSAHITFHHARGFEVEFGPNKPRYCIASISAYALSMFKLGGGFSICLPEEK